MLYLERIPAPPLDGAIRSIWYCENAPAAQTLKRVLPAGTAQLIVNLKADQARLYRPQQGFACQTAPGTVLTGVQSRYCVIARSVISYTIQAHQARQHKYLEDTPNMPARLLITRK